MVQINPSLNADGQPTAKMLGRDVCFKGYNIVETLNADGTINAAKSDILYDTSTKSLGAKNFLKNISQYSALAWCFYNSNREYSIEYIPVAEWKKKYLDYPLYLNGSSSGTTRYLLVYYLSDTSFQIKERSAATLRRVWGIK